MPSSWINEKAASSINPHQVERTLLELEANWPAEAPPLAEFLAQFPLGEAPLLHLIAVSSICAARFIRDPNLLLWLNDPEISASARGHNRMIHELNANLPGPIAADNFRPLRLWKGREMTRISLREVAAAAPLEETTAELSQLAEICLARVFDYWDGELRNRWGSPDADFAVIGLGKLGGRELNHSSDIDIIFVYSEEGQVTPRLSNHEWFSRLAAKICEAFSFVGPSGSLFRIDLRLRPEGSSGPLARSLESMENYYAGFGETWERLALIKARGICGSAELAYDFTRQHQPFIFPKSPTPDLLDEIAAIKRRIERDVVGHENLDRNVKLGVGGIREIEFVVQALQFIHGARNTFLQETGTLAALRGLAQLDLLPKRDVAQLDGAYRFLRTVEHRLQIESEQQTHTVPADGESLQRLALSLGFESAKVLRRKLDRHMANVRRVFISVIESSHHRPQAPFDVDIFANPERAAKTLAQLEGGAKAFHVAPRTRQVFRKLKPLLLQWLAAAADPDAALNQFVRFVEAYGLRSMLFELLVGNPRFLELVVKTLDGSRFAGDLMIRRPQVVEDLTRGGMLDASLDTSQQLRRMQSLGASAASLDLVRAYRQSELLRIILRDVLGLSRSPELLTELSALAEASLVFVNDLLNHDQLTIVALGKFGGSEIGYGADLDILFVGDNSKAAQTLIATMAQPSAEGTLPALDARLRPDGEKGSLVLPLWAYGSYYATRAQLWELQALTRARPIAGLEQREFVEIAQRAWRGAGERPTLFAEIGSMLHRIREGRSSGADELNIKTGAGGIIEAEFLVQALQMRAGVWEPNFAAAVGKLADAAVLNSAQAATLKANYLVLRRCENALRRWENKSVSTLPADETEQRKLARRCGETIERFPVTYRTAREQIRALSSALTDGAW
jgi:glutamate-ammonia-ligase adenylyltransferase